MPAKNNDQFQKSFNPSFNPVQGSGGTGIVPGLTAPSPSQNQAQREGFLPIANPQSISVVNTADWFGPLQPLKTAAPLGTEVRRMEYMVGQNLMIQPRANEAIRFETLRALADSCDLLRTVIETQKALVTSVPWEIHAVGKPGESVKARKQRESEDPNITRITKLVKRPNPDDTWATFVNQLLEDKLVLDAPSVWMRRAADTKSIAQLVPIDGSRITRYITTSGMTPQPPDAAYNQYLYGTNSVDLTTQDIVYRPANVRTHKIYGYSPVEQIVVAVNLYLRREMSLLSYYTEGNIPEMIAFLPNTMTPDQIKEFEGWFNSVEQGNSSFKRRVRFLQNPTADGKPALIQTKDAMLSDPIDEWLARLICFAFNITPTQLVKMMNRATAQQSSEDVEESGIAPTLIWLADLMNYIIQEQMGFADYEFQFQPRRETDLLKQRQADEIKVKSGGMTLNEWREAEGQDPYDPVLYPDADKPIILTATGYFVLGDQQTEQQNEPTDPTDPAEQDPDNESQTDDPPVSNTARKFVKAYHRASVRPDQYNPQVHAAQLHLHQTMRKSFDSMKDHATQALNVYSKSRPPAQERQVGKADGNPDSDDESGPDASQLSTSIWQSIEDDFRSMPVEIQVALEQAISAGVQEGAIGIGMSHSLINDVNTIARDWARDRAAQMVGMKYADDGSLVPNPDAQWRIDDTTRERINKIVADAFTQENPLDVVAQRIQDISDPSNPFSDARAQMIARTEAANAQVRGNVESWKASGVVTKVQWLVDGDPCVECLLNAGEIRTLGEPFPSGDTMPTVHPNCACGLAAVFETS